MDYLRARYMDPQTGRFASADQYAGNINMPMSLQRYLYAGDNPVNFTDPSGNQTLVELEVTMVLDSTGLSIQRNEAKFGMELLRRVAFVSDMLLKPAGKIEDVALGMIGNNVDGGFELYLVGQTLEVVGYRAWRLDPPVLSGYAEKPRKHKTVGIKSEWVNFNVELDLCSAEFKYDILGYKGGSEANSQARHFDEKLLEFIDTIRKTIDPQVIKEYLSGGHEMEDGVKQIQKIANWLLGKIPTPDPSKYNGKWGLGKS